MSGAVFAMAANVVVTCLFAICFAGIAFSSIRQRVALWFSASYAVGVLTPLSELLARFMPWPELFSFIGYVAFLCAPLIFSAGIARFNRHAIDRVGIAAILFGGVALRIGLFWGTRTTLPYELLYQVPFALAAGHVAVTMVRTGRHDTLHVGCAATFGLIALHFLTKPVFAMLLGSGRTARDYALSTYALFSQAATGILLVGAGLIMLLLVFRHAVSESRNDAETDSLTDITNRRGFTRLAGAALHRAARDEAPLSLAVFDLDHFKTINDTHGHDTGDQVIVAFARLLRAAAPQKALVARLGGEEFAMLLEGTADEGAWLSAEAVRVAVATLGGGLPQISVSGGVAQLRSGDSLSDLMRRADEACYRAKHEGRDRVYSAPAPPSPPPPRTGQVVPLNAARR